jgi:intraflagellar transport protein 122
MLRNLSPNEVVVKPSGCALIRPRYFRLMDTESPVTVDENGCFYEADEYELACLEFGRTPFTRLAVNVGDEVASAVEPETPPQRTSSSKWGTARGAKTVGSLVFAGN